MNTTLQYPGVPLKFGSRVAEVVALQIRLNDRGCGPLAATGRFDAETKRAVKRFQARFPDVTGQPLLVDGIVGPITWEALFGAALTPTPPPPSLATAALSVAVSEIGTMEVPPGSNRGPRIDQYLLSVGLDPVGQHPWCAAFVFFCFAQAAAHAGVPNPVIRTGSVLTHWRRASELHVPRIETALAQGSPALVQPGFVFIMEFGSGAGHTGFVERVDGGRLVTIEGNTNDGGSREGVGVFRRTARKISHINKGFVDYR